MVQNGIWMEFHTLEETYQLISSLFIFRILFLAGGSRPGGRLTSLQELDSRVKKMD
jgi:hypothetical protein